MSYVDAYHDRAKDVIYVSERVNGKRHIVTHKPEYNFYYADPRGKKKSIFGDPVTEVLCKNYKDFKKNVAINPSGQLYETDIAKQNIRKTLSSQMTLKYQTAYCIP